MLPQYSSFQLDLQKMSAQSNTDHSHLLILQIYVGGSEMNIIPMVNVYLETDCG